MAEDRMNAHIKLINDGIKFSCTSENYPEIITDYYPPLGNNEGYKPLELFLLSLGTCISGTVLPLLRRMKKNIGSYAMEIGGVRKKEHPTGFSMIQIHILMTSNDIEESDLVKALQLAEEKYCPVWSMIDKSTKIEHRFTITRT